MNKLISNCPLCGERALHVIQDIGKGLDNQQCIHCGYVTSNLFKLNKKSKEDNEKYNTLTNEMKSWLREANDRIWIPTIMTLPLGMLYPIDVEVVNEEDSKIADMQVTENVMKWAFAEMIQIPKEEQKNYPIPDKDGEFYAQRYGIDNQKIYDEFIYALAELNDRVKNES